MPNQSIRRISVILILITLVLSACNLPSVKKTPPDSAGLIHTIAAQTVEAQLTLEAAGNQGNQNGDSQQPGDQEDVEGLATQTETPFPTLTPQPLPSDTPIPSPSITPIPCDHITWGKDVTIPDGTELVPGEVFTKTWRLKNTGTCTWTSGYSLVFETGDAMGAPPATQLTTGTVPPGQQIDVSIVLEAPVSAGTYQGYFKLRNTEGEIFGLGDESKHFWVKITVPDVSGVMLDFIALADEAVWGSGVTPYDFDGPGDIELDYGLPVDTSNGYVTTQSNIVLEGGSTSGVVLETRPKNDTDGYIMGRYPEYKVGAGDYIKGRIGFLAENPSGSCGAGDAVFQINYTLGHDLDTMTKLVSWKEKCDGTLRKISVDLSALKGETVRFYLIVQTNGSPADDKAIWASLGVMR
jgi:hypothetical protein